MFDNEGLEQDLLPAGLFAFSHAYPRQSCGWFSFRVSSGSSSRRAQNIPTGVRKTA
jgi:hypothetical protein